jgi:hypothetical protein
MFAKKLPAVGKRVLHMRWPKRSQPAGFLRRDCHESVGKYVNGKTRAGLRSAAARALRWHERHHHVSGCMCIMDDFGHWEVCGLVPRQGLPGEGPKVFRVPCAIFFGNGNAQRTDHNAGRDVFRPFRGRRRLAQQALLRRRRRFFVDQRPLPHHPSRRSARRPPPRTFFPLYTEKNRRKGTARENVEFVGPKTRFQDAAQAARSHCPGGHVGKRTRSAPVFPISVCVGFGENVSCVGVDRASPPKRMSQRSPPKAPFLKLGVSEKRCE